jgi:hypothetical protein
MPFGAAAAVPALRFQRLEHRVVHRIVSRACTALRLAAPITPRPLAAGDVRRLSGAARWRPIAVPRIVPSRRVARRLTVVFPGRAAITLLRRTLPRFGLDDALLRRIEQ